MSLLGDHTTRKDNKGDQPNSGETTWTNTPGCHVMSADIWYFVLKSREGTPTYPGTAHVSNNSLKTFLVVTTTPVFHSINCIVKHPISYIDTTLGIVRSDI